MASEDRLAVVADLDGELGGGGDSAGQRVVVCASVAHHEPRLRIDALAQEDAGGIEQRYAGGEQRGARVARKRPPCLVSETMRSMGISVTLH